MLPGPGHQTRITPPPSGATLGGGVLRNPAPTRCHHREWAPRGLSHTGPPTLASSRRQSHSCRKARLSSTVAPAQWPGLEFPPAGHSPLCNPPSSTQPSLRGLLPTGGRRGESTTDAPLPPAPRAPPDRGQASLLQLPTLTLEHGVLKRVTHCSCEH